MSEVQKEEWRIRISGYGTFDFFGTEEQAEDRRKSKAKWEGAISSAKWRKTPRTVSEKLVELREWFFENERGCPIWVITKIKQAKKAEKPDAP